MAQNKIHMNQNVQEFLKKRKSEHLISLGLIDEAKTKREYQYYDYSVPGAKFDDAKNQYLLEKTTYFPIEVTDEEYQEILKYAPMSESKVETVKGKVSKRSWSNIIKTIALVYLVGGILISVFVLFLHGRYYLGQAICEAFITIFFLCISFSLVMGLSTIVAAAEKYLKR